MSNRHCGSCTKCCTLVPVEVLHKPANTKCKHLTRRGCAIYARLPDLVPECRLWSCQWLVDPDAGELHRPDRTHYVIDIMPDFIGAHDPYGTGTDEVVNVPVMQIWVDPLYPDAWDHDPALRRYIEHIAKTRGMATLIRWGNAKAMAIFPPSMMNDGHWHRKESAPSSGQWTNPMQRIHDIGKAARREDGGSLAVALARAVTPSTP